ncbi:MAG: hypothetical protein GY769_16465 [bacterium]|nr:hypothetical protein [bacterium]
MKELEKQAERLLGELTELRRKNRVLAARVKKLEKASADLENSRSSESSEGLVKERAEVKRRVQRLVTRLEKLDTD